MRGGNCECARVLTERLSTLAALVHGGVEVEARDGGAARHS